MMKPNMRLSHLLVLCFLSIVIGQSYAGVRQYSARLENSNWQLLTNSRLMCELSHQIPRYGDAVFQASASKEPSLRFALDMLRLPENYSVASVQSIAPAWRPGIPTKFIADMQLLKQFNGEIPNNAAWTMLTELEQGMSPTIYYADWNSPYDKVAVRLNSINFHPVYDEFLQCRYNLLPYSFDDIAYTVLNYKLNSDQLTKSSQKRLTMIGEYLKAAPELELGLISAYTDSHGGRWHNQKLSERRANTIKNYFAEMGVAEARIVSQGYGEKRHVASNQDVLSRGKNRRVVIQLEPM